MEANSTLDYFEIQLLPPCSSSSDRCELFVVQKGHREKLASVFLKQILSHLRAAHEQFAGGSQAAVRLDCPQPRGWFNRGTLQRFVRFISTPEVLERVKSIEDELLQLEQVRDIQASSLNKRQSSASYDAANPALSRTDAALHVEPCHTSYVTLNQQVTVNEAETSKLRMELLRAMDARLLALHQEQTMAFTRAFEAGFNVDGIRDLIAFSVYFGAERLGLACNQFMELLAKSQGILNEHLSSSSDMSISSPGGDLLGEVSVCFNGDKQATLLEVHNNSYSRNKNLKAQKKRTAEMVGSNGQAGEQVNIGDHEQSLNTTMDAERSEVSPESTITTRDAEMDRWPLDSSSPASRQYVSDSNFPKHSPEAGLASQASSSVGAVQRSSSLKRRSASPLKRVQVGRLGNRRGSGSVAVRSINYFCHMSRDKNNFVESCSSDSEDEKSQPPSIKAGGTPVRRLSVQAAINLFESKQQSNDRQANKRGSIEVANSHMVKSIFCGRGTESREMDCIATSKCHEQLSNDLTEHVSATSQVCIEAHNHVNVQQVDKELSSQDHTEALNYVKKDVVPWPSGNMALSGLGEPEVDDSQLSTSTKQTLHDKSNVSDLCGSANLVGKAEKTHSSSSFLSPVEFSSPGEEEVIHLKRESFGSSWIVSSDANMEALIKLIDHSAIEDGWESGHEGRFYEQYRKLRDAKLTGEHHCKRAEREAKLKYIKEALELSKAEMLAQNSRLSRRKNDSQVYASKAGNENASVLKGDLITRPVDNLKLTSQTPICPSVGPPDSKEHMTARLSIQKKTGGAAQKAQPRCSNRSSSSSPKSTPKGARVSTQSRVVSSPINNPLTRSVPCLGDLRKENGKPSPGRSSICTHVKNEGGATFNEPCPPESKSKVTLQKSREGKADRKYQNTLERKSCMGNDLKQLTIDGALIKGQKGMVIDTSTFSKLRRSSVAPIQDTKPFLRKGRGIGPGAGPGVAKSKASTADDATKSSDADALLKEENDAFLSKSLEVDETGAKQRDHMDEPGSTDLARLDIEIETSSLPLTIPSTTLSGDANTVDHDICVVGSSGVDVGDDAMFDQDTTQHSIDELFDFQEDTEKFHGSMMEDDVAMNEKACRTMSFPLDSEMHKHFTSSCALEAQNNLHCNEQAYWKGDCVIETNTAVRNSMPEKDVSDLQIVPAPPISPSSSTCTMRPVTLSDHFSPSIARVVSPLVESPASWQSQMQYISKAEAMRLNKKRGGSHILDVSASKEPSKGLKRLLNFARKTRTTEACLSDTISASTVSEVGEDPEEFKEINSVVRNLHESSETRPSQFYQTSIPAPPANFNLRDNRSYKGTSIKGPMSFFSLSTFRSRGTQGKSR